MKKSNYITTYSKIHFTPTDPKIEDIKIEDIAHSLSLLCRANGHCKEFFSVAQHSLNCAREARAWGYSKRIQLACLLHDASEAYLSDVPRPLKLQMPEYKAFENKLEAMVYEKYIGESVSEEEHLKIKQIDDAMLYCEFAELMWEKAYDKAPEVRSSPSIGFRDFGEVEAEFLAEFEKLL